MVVLFLFLPVNDSVTSNQPTPCLFKNSQPTRPHYFQKLKKFTLLLNVKSHNKINCGNLPLLQKVFVHPTFHAQQSVHVFKIKVYKAIAIFQGFLQMTQSDCSPRNVDCSVVVKVCNNFNFQSNIHCQNLFCCQHALFNIVKKSVCLVVQYLYYPRQQWESFV